jgi:glycine/D-amino acid oxidase-like deaminating enzyme/nitrite reductase/ring-hydroxylating ferredoxin subunit
MNAGKHSGSAAMPESGRTVSLWQDEFEAPETRALDGDATCDVCVVGGGIAGLTTAYLLAQDGASVIVLEDGKVGSGVTLRTTGHLCNSLDDRFYKLEDWHGHEGARLAAESHTAAIERIESIAVTERIECDFRRVDAYLVAGAPGQKGREELDLENAAAQRAGLPTALASVPIVGFDWGPAVRFPRQAQFHAGRYLAGLAGAAQRLGVVIHSDTHAGAISGGKSCKVETKRGATVSSRAVVVATNVPINDRVVMHTKQAAYRTFVIAMRVERDRVPALLLYDTLDPYHYVRTQPASDGVSDWLIVGGEDRKTGQHEDEQAHAFAMLYDWTRERFPFVGEPEYRWSGQVMEPHDGVAFIGQNPVHDENVYIVTGDSGNGLTHGTIAGMLLTDLIGGRENPWSKLYHANRKSLRTAGTFINETANFVAQYADFAQPGEIKDPVELGNGEGGIIRRGVALHALYRDQRGSLHEMSAVCPHLGCAVRWNSVEKTWDCPCHGSRFAAADGHVINGPANAGLARIEHKRVG